MNKSFSDHYHPYTSMTLIGQGQVTAIPNIAKVQLGVQLVGDNLEAVQSENARISQNILQAIKQLGISDIKTSDYTIDKNYSYENNNRIDKGFLVQNIFEIKVSDLDLVGTLIDTSVQKGANVINFITFEVSNPDFYYQQALNFAVANAFQKAKSISTQLRANMEPIPIRIIENSSLPVASLSRYRTGENAFVTPIEPGDYQLNASVTVEFISKYTS